MVIITQKFEIHTKPDEIINITKQVKSAISNSEIKNGIVCVFMPGSTGGISTLEFEPGLVNKDVPALLQQLMPEGPNYAHHQTWGDHNGHSHLRSFMIPPSLSIPIIKGTILLGTWQQIVFCEFDEKARTRTIFCQIMGEN
jgi:secondary thiamine-phosphate synthase enzyme